MATCQCGAYLHSVTTLSSGHHHNLWWGCRHCPTKTSWVIKGVLIIATFHDSLKNNPTQLMKSTATLSPTSQQPPKCLEPWPILVQPACWYRQQISHLLSHTKETYLILWGCKAWSLQKSHYETWRLPHSKCPKKYQVKKENQVRKQFYDIVYEI